MANALTKCFRNKLGTTIMFAWVKSESRYISWRHDSSYVLCMYKMTIQMSTCDEIRGLSSICKYSQAMWTVRSMAKRFVSVQISDSCIFTCQTVRQLHFHMSVVFVFLCFCCAKDKTWCNAILVSGIRHGATELAKHLMTIIIKVSKSCDFCLVTVTAIASCQ